MNDNAKNIILKNYLSPGDVLCMTAAVLSLQRTHPGKFNVGVDTSCPSVWDFNPDIIPLDRARELNADVMEMHYPLIHKCNQEPVHMLNGYCEYLSSVLSIPVPLVTNKPFVYLSNEEKGWINQVEQMTSQKRKFWIVNAGVKPDYTAKAWPWFQQVVDRLQGKILFVQVGKSEHMHKPLNGVIDLLGKTDDRQLIRLVHHAEGVLCGTTFLMHLAAALEKPSVIVAGSREPRSWNTYPSQVLLSNIGSMSCQSAQGKACWRSRVVKLNDGSEQDHNLCEQPVGTDPPTARCMAMISAEDVCRGIESFYVGGRLGY